MKYEQMKKYLLDTHIIVWLLLKNNELSENIKEEIEYYQHIYYVSVVSLHEIILLKEIKRIKTEKTISEIINDIKEYNINILDIKGNHIETLERLSKPSFKNKPHEDPFDRVIISQGISENMTVISADTRFPLYKDKGFNLREN